VEALALAPLGLAATLQLIRATAGEALPPQRLAVIAERAEGVPLFAEELARAAEADGEIPTTLYGCLMGRLDRDPVARGVAQIAATIGREFERPLLDAVEELPSSALDAGLAALTRDGLVAQTGRTTYAFHHALIQDAARGSLLRERRAELDRRIAEALVERLPEVAEAYPERVARHFESAGRTRDAVVHWEKAGLAAMARSANQEASSHFGRALALVDRMPPGEERDRTELGLRVLAALPVRATQGWSAPEVVAHFERAEALCGVVEDAPQLFPTLYGLITYRLVSGQLEDALALGTEQVAVVEATGDGGLILEAESVTGNVLVYLGRHAESEARLRRVLGLHDPVRHADHLVHFGHDPRAVTLMHLGMIRIVQGDTAEARRLLEAAVASTRECRHPFTEAWTLSCGAFLEVLSPDELDAAALRRHAETAIAIASSQGFPNWEAQAWVYLGWERAQAGDPARGVELARRGVELWESTGTVLVSAFLRGLLADALRCAGDPATGLDMVDGSLSLAARTGDRWLLPELQRIRSGLLADLGRTDEARSAACTAVDRAESDGAHGLARRARARLADIEDGARVA
jgi:predicted ATPase